LVLGVADESVVPYLERELAAAGAAPRLAAGLPLERTRPLRLLRAVARYLRRAGFAELAALARESDLAVALQPGGDASAPLDSSFVERRPRGARGPWIAADPRVHEVEGFQRRLDELLGPLAAGGTRPLARWAEPIRALLAALHPRPLEPENEHERALAEALARVGAALGELEEVPESLRLPELAAPA